MRASTKRSRPYTKTLWPGDILEVTMAVYKVPQDVEAEDKLLGPFSFRQFVYLIIVAIAIAIAWFLSTLFIPLAIIPLPIILFFGALALPLRKDQPMEIYLAALVSFYLKPRRRLWQPDGITSLVEITAPKVIEVQRAKDITQSEADRRFSYLANIVDSGGWAVRGVGVPAPNSPMATDVYFEAQQTEDMLDNQGGISQSFDQMIAESDQKHRQAMIERMHQPVQPAPVVMAPLAPVTAAPNNQFVIPPQPAPAVPTQVTSLPGTTPGIPEPHLEVNPYPTMHQSVIRPLDEQVAPQQQTPTLQAVQSQQTAAPQVQEPVAQAPQITSEKPVSPDIISLANNPDLSIETIAREAQRIHKKEDSEEVVISLR